MSLKENDVLYKGGCHCKAIEFQVLSSPNLVVWKCNCSICNMKQNYHFVVPKDKFRLIKGEDYLTLYQFNTKTAKHYFCKICGVQSFYIPRSNPDGVAVTFNCINNLEVGNSVKFEAFDGIQWEKTIKNSEIKKFSKL